MASKNSVHYMSHVSSGKYYETKTAEIQNMGYIFAMRFIAVHIPSPLSSVIVCHLRELSVSCLDPSHLCELNLSAV